MSSQVKNTSQANKAYLDRFRVVCPARGSKAKFVVMYPTSETHGKTVFFETKEEAEAFKQQKIDEYLKPKPLAKPTVNVTRWVANLESELATSLKTVEFFYVYRRTAGKNLTRFLDNYSAKVAAETEWVNTWVDIWQRCSSYKQIVRECTKVNKARAKAEAKEAKARAKAAAKEAKAKAKAEAKAKAKAKAKPTPTEQLQARLAKLEAEMDQFSRRMAADRAKADTVKLLPLSFPAFRSSPNSKPRCNATSNESTRNGSCKSSPLHTEPATTSATSK